MREPSRIHFSMSAAAFAVAVLAGCATPRHETAPAKDDTTCKAAAPGEPLLGTWLSVRRERGVTGELRTLFTFRSDGTMGYAEQLSRPRGAPQGLSESGCWHREGDVLVLRTRESNGSPVDVDDPIYTNRYRLTREGGDRIGLSAPDGAQLDARRMPAEYRLPL